MLDDIVIRVLGLEMKYAIREFRESELEHRLWVRFVSYD